LTHYKYTLYNVFIESGMVRYFKNKTEKQMKNFINGNEYTGGNVTTLEDAGFADASEFATFRQIKKHFNLQGKEMKGAKSVATLMRVVVKKVVNKKTGKKEDKKFPKYFSVFEKNEVIAVLQSNGFTL